MGLECEIDGKTVLAGNEKLLRAHGIDFSPRGTEAGILVYIARVGEYLGCVEIQDRVKETRVLRSPC